MLAPRSGRPLDSASRNREAFWLGFEWLRQLLRLARGARMIFAAVSGLLLPVVATGQEAWEAATLQQGRDRTQLFYERRFGPIWEVMSPRMKELVPSPQALGDVWKAALGPSGSERAVERETTMREGAIRVYSRVARFENSADLLEIVWFFGDEGSIDGFLVRPAETEAPTAKLGYRTKTPLHLPFRGRWDVAWGGRTISQNRHAASSDQRFAYDLLVFVDGTSHTGGGSSNEDYHCWGREILSPGSGTVITSESALRDNLPGVMSPDHALGNHVIIDHGNGEYSFLAHFKQGSVTVTAGQSVNTGERLGSCGNSGNSSEPHLHYHLQTTPEFSAGEGLPIQFLDYVADEERVVRGEPVKGQRIRPGRLPEP